MSVQTSAGQAFCELAQDCSHSWVQLESHSGSHGDSVGVIAVIARRRPSVTHGNLLGGTVFRLPRSQTLRPSGSAGKCVERELKKGLF